MFLVHVSCFGSCDLVAGFVALVRNLFFLASHSYSRALFLGPCCLFLVRAFISVATLVRRFAPHDNRESLCPLYWQKL